MAIEVRSAGMPSGTVTFLFTDIEGSTQGNPTPTRCGWRSTAHDAVLPAAIDARGTIVQAHR